MIRTVQTLAAAFVAIAVLAYFASPLWALGALRSAARSRDQNHVERMVDFPSVRAHLKRELSARLQAALHNTPLPATSPTAGLGAALPPTLVNGAVDAFVTPAGVAGIVESGEGPTFGPSPAAPAANASAVRIRTTFSYVDLDQCRITLTRSDTPDRHVGLLFERHNLFFWRLTRIDLPFGGAASQ
jgi:hypothetical protein